MSAELEPLPAGGSVAETLEFRHDGLVKHFLATARTFKLSISLAIRKSATMQQGEQKVFDDSLGDAKQSLKAVQSRYPKTDPYILAVEHAAAKLRQEFHDLTYTHPEPGKRLFVLDSKASDWQAHAGEQLTKFYLKMQRKIDVYRRGPVQDLIDNWPAVLDSAREFCGKLYDASVYPKQGELADLLQVQFSICGDQLADEIKPDSMLAIAAAKQQHAMMQAAVRKEISSLCKQLRVALVHLGGTLTQLHDPEHIKKVEAEKAAGRTRAGVRLYESALMGPIGDAGRLRRLLGYVNDPADLFVFTAASNFIGRRNMIPGETDKQKLDTCRKSKDQSSSLATRAQQLAGALTDWEAQRGLLGRTPDAQD